MSTETTQVFRRTGFRTLFSTSVDHHEGFFFAEMHVTAELDVDVVIHHGASPHSPKTELSFTPDRWPEFRAVMLEIIAEADRLMPQIGALQPRGPEAGDRTGETTQCAAPEGTS